ncbi:hypothetical protein Ccrd_001413, partial [Cynara cardunculus var. scolymus]
YKKKKESKISNTAENLVDVDDQSNEVAILNVGQAKQRATDCSTRRETICKRPPKSREDSKDDDDFEVQDQNKRKKVKSVKEDTKGIEDNGKCTIKTHLPLCTRTSPKPLYTMIQNLPPSQIECVKEMGFEGLLNMKTDGIPAKLGYYVVDSFDSQNMLIKLENTVIPITVKKIHEMIGAPIGGAPLDSLVNDNCGVNVVEQWKSRYLKPSLRVTDI